LQVVIEFCIRGGRSGKTPRKLGGKVLNSIKANGWGRTSVVSTILFAGAVQYAAAATQCVNPGKAGCWATIGTAVSHAAAGDVIEVAPGTYKEMVVIGKALTLSGKNFGSTTIDASGLSNGIFIDGLDAPGLAHVTVSGFTVENANFEGILVANASYVTVQGNRIMNNDRSLDFANLSCPGLPDFETAEGFDCGEGIHLTGVSSSLFAGNTITHNAGGILISDETGPTHNNMIDGNDITDNVLDCGITMPSHPRAPGFGPPVPPFGVYGNVISNNVSSGNGTIGQGAGVGIFAFLPGARVSDNLIAGNRITNNGIPGIAFHAHAPGINLNNNKIIGNYIAGNGADDDPDALTTVPTGINIAGIAAASPITGTEITNNVIKDEGIDIAAHAAGLVVAQQNNLNGNGDGVANLGTGSVDARNNWWGCAKGPNAQGCSSTAGNVQTTPWLAAPAVPNGAPRQ
jgi:Right handed beta helix region